MLALRSVWSEVRRDPLRATLTVVGLALGIAIVTLTVNVGNTLHAQGVATFPTPGDRVTIGNASLDTRGELEYTTDPVFAADDMEAIRAQIPTVVDIAPVEGLGIDYRTVLVDEVLYETRMVLAVGADYATVYGLDMVAGRFFTAEEVEGEQQVVVLSESAAQAIFGTAPDAVGRGIAFRRLPDRALVSSVVVGVFADVSADLRRTYGIADLLLPLGRSRPAHAFIARTVGSSPAALQTAVETLLRARHGPDTPVLVWKGGPFDSDQPTPDTEQNRDTLSVTLFLDAFGALALLIASTGVLTMAMVGIVERSRSIGIRRALGSTRLGIVSWLVGESVLLGLAAGLLGLVLAAVFVAPAMAAFGPALPAPDGGRMVLPPKLRPESIIMGLGSGLVAAALSSLAPAITASRTAPVESLREAG